MRCPTRSLALWARAISDGISPTTIRSIKNADSVALLATVWKRATDLGWRLVNADVTIFAAQPKLAPHLPAMSGRLASALGTDARQVNVKASNPEGLGALGRGEGMAAAAIVMLQAD